jgi:hypothetical protein
MKKSGRLVLFLLLALIITSLTATLALNFVSAEDPLELDLIEDSSNSKVFNFSEKLDIWLKGGEGTSAEDLGELLKWLVLILVIILIYSALSFVNFPENGIAKIAIAIIVGFLATFLITTAELLTSLQSYTALGVTLTLFFPIMILGFFTIVVATKGNPVGIFLQKIMWVIYSVYLFIKTGILYLFKLYYVTNPKPGIKFPAYWPKGLKEFGVDLMSKFATNETINSLGRYDAGMLLTLLISAIAVFFIMVPGNKIVRTWFAQQKIDAEIESKKAKITRSDARDKINAKAMEDQ